MSDEYTRTELGYAAWKDFPSMVKRARAWAGLGIAVTKVEREFTELVTPFIGWLDDKLTRKARNND